VKVEQLSRAARFSTNLGLKLLDATLEGLIRGLLDCFGAERLSMFIERDWSILESVFYGLYRPPIEAYRMMKPEEVRRLEAFRRSLAKAVLPVLSMARTIASRFPPEAVEGKVTADWLLQKGEKRFPQVVEVVKKHGDRGRAWVEAQAKQIRDYLLGRIVFNPATMKFVRAEELRAVAEKM
jgi:hypothetical protein